MFKLDLKTAPLSVLRALALSIARDIDRGAEDLRDLLEDVIARVQTAKEGTSR